jgi:MFS family permease
MQGRIILWSITSALAGFLFGFDTVVISGAEQTIQALWHLDPGTHGIAVAAALYGTVAGSLLGAWLADTLGRRPTLMLIGLLYLVGAVWSARPAWTRSAPRARSAASASACPRLLRRSTYPRSRRRATGGA